MLNNTALYISSCVSFLAIIPVSAGPLALTAAIANEHASITVRRHFSSHICDISTQTLNERHGVSNHRQLKNNPKTPPYRLFARGFHRKAQYRVTCFMNTGDFPDEQKTPLSFSPHDDVIKWKYFRVTVHLCGEFTGPRWIPCTKASDAELWCFL